jgi:hypothetical protein
MNDLIFKVHGPFDVPVEQKKFGKMILPGCPGFWKHNTKFQNEYGCYVFAIRAAKGYRPVYIGKTKKTFKQECFTDHKIGRHYNPSLLDTGKGTPVMFFLIPSLKKGKPNHKKISDLESFLIQIGVSRNPDLSNVQGRDEKLWGISGIMRCGKGKANNASKEFKKLMGL